MRVSSTSFSLNDELRRSPRSWSRGLRRTRGGRGEDAGRTRTSLRGREEEAGTWSFFRPLRSKSTVNDPV
eukprot:753955-Hanusia_phi.AAC.7